MSVDVPTVAARRGGFMHDTWVIAKRGLVHIRRHPEALTDATIQPIMFVLLFAYVFGGAIGVIIAQTLVFSSFGVAISLAHDRSNGAIDRFRALPISRASVLAGHALAQLLRGLIPIALMSVTGLAIGWRIHSSFVDAVGGYLLMLLILFAMIWVGVLLAALLSSPEAVQGLAFVLIFPLTFVATTFVPYQSFGGVLRPFVAWNPVSAWSQALRKLLGNPLGETDGASAWSMSHPVAYSVITACAIIAICAPLAIRAYQRSTTA
jgi:ABC transporter DrrB family efflux protein